MWGRPIEEEGGGRCERWLKAESHTGGLGYLQQRPVGLGPGHSTTIIAAGWGSHASGFPGASWGPVLLAPCLFWIQTALIEV